MESYGKKMPTGMAYLCSTGDAANRATTTVMSLITIVDLLVPAYAKSIRKSTFLLRGT